MTLEENSQFLDREQVQRAVTALREYVAEQKKTSLDCAMDEVENIQLQFTFKKVPSEEQNIRVALPHSLVQDTSDVCLIVSDLNRKDRDYQPTIRHYKKLLEKHGITAVSQILPLKQIKLEYQPFEAKRHLSNMYDVFLADAAVMRLLPEILGKAFYGRKRIPMQVKLDASNLKREIDKALHKSLCPISGKGPTGLVKVAHSALGVNESVENIMAAAETLGQSLPGGASNIRNMHLRTAESPALPIYMSNEKEEKVKLPHSNRKRKGLQMGPSEVSTVMGAKVRVTSHGTVRVISNQKLKKMETQKSQNNTENTKKRSGKKENKRKRSGKEKKVRKQLVKKNTKLEEKEAEEYFEELCGSDSEARKKENEALKMRSNREEIDADLFSDTTADSELSESEEVAPPSKKVKHEIQAKKAAETNSKRKETKKKTTNRNVKTNKNEPKSRKRVANTQKVNKGKSKNVKKS